MLISSHIINCGTNVILPFYNLIFIVSPKSTIWRILKSQPTRTNFTLSRGFSSLFPRLHKSFSWCWEEMSPDSHSSSAHTGLPDTHILSGLQQSGLVDCSWKFLSQPQVLMGTLGSVTLGYKRKLSAVFGTLVIPHSQEPSYSTQLSQLYCKACCFPRFHPKVGAFYSQIPELESTRLILRITWGPIILPSNTEFLFFIV